MIVGLANLVLLTVLLALWTDDLEMTFHPLARPVGFLAILGFCFLSAMVVFVAKGRYPIVLTVLVSSYLYFTYAQRVVSNRILHGTFRERLAAKIKPSVGLANGTEAAGLTNREYRTVAAVIGLPTLPPVAGNISYAYQYDGFLPDYSISLIYDVPGETPIAAYDSTKARFSRYQSVETHGALKRVTYWESVN